MPRTHRASSALVAALAALAAAACAPGSPRPIAAPAPAPAPAEPAPAPAAVDLGATFDLGVAPAEPVAAGLLGTARYDLPVEANRWVEMELAFLVNQRKAVVGRWMENGERYSAWVQDVFAGYGLPRDLHHLAMVESGYNPRARSHAGALGMWQFMPATGRMMGLRIDDEVDERMDPVRSTHAAARHLLQLRDAFRGNWPLAAAAYNAGQGRISRGMTRFGAGDFWDLAERGDLAQETRHYVPRLYAVTIIARDPQRFGYTPAQGLVRYFRYDSIRVEVPTPLSVLASLANLPAAELQELNPHLHRGYAPAGYQVWVPHGTGTALAAAWEGSEFRRRGGFGWYTLRRGEDLAEVARLTGLSADEIRGLNLGTNVDRLGRGDRVRLYADVARPLAARPAGGSTRLASSEGSGSRAASATRHSARPAEREAAEASDEAKSAPEPARAPAASRSRTAPRGEGRTTTHRVEDGETLWSIARRYDVSVERIREANELRGETIRPGQSLRIPRAASGAAARAREPETTTHTVRGGQTLWAIAREYDTTVESIRRANDLDEDEAIQPGQRLRIPRR